jgi:hypothetical protein
MAILPDIPLVLPPEALAEHANADGDHYAVLIAFYAKIRDAYGFKTTWSIFEVRDFTQTPEEDALRIHYPRENGFGRSASAPLAINNLTWLDLWRAADHCIVRSGDQHHRFIEGLDYKALDRTFLLITGS